MKNPLVVLQVKKVIGATSGSPGFKGKPARTPLHFFAEALYILLIDCQGTLQDRTDDAIVKLDTTDYKTAISFLRHFPIDFTTGKERKIMPGNKKSRRIRPLQRMPRVAIVLESAHENSRGHLRGIMKYIRLYGPWGLHITSGGRNDVHLPLVEQWKATGIIAQVPNEKVAKTIVAANLPTVMFHPFDSLLVPRHPLSKVCRCVCDNRRIGQLAAEHFLKQGFEHFALVPNRSQANWARERFEAFQEHLARSGKKAVVYPISVPIECDWGIEFKKMIPWLRRLPKPTAVFTPDDLRGRQVLDACLIANIKIPHQLAVLGVANDKEVCETTTPPLSSVAIDTESGGFAVAQMLDGLMRGTLTEQKIFICRPKEIVRRGSAEAASFHDPIVLQALEFIRINSGFSIRVSDVARHLKQSSRSIERHFKNVLGHSVLSEIQRVRMESIRKLVAHTTTPFREIAALCGLESATYLGEIFKKEFGMTMGEYRESFPFLPFEAKISRGDRIS